MCITAGGRPADDSEPFLFANNIQFPAAPDNFWNWSTANNSWGNANFPYINALDIVNVGTGNALWSPATQLFTDVDYGVGNTSSSLHGCFWCDLFVDSGVAGQATSPFGTMGNKATDTGPIMMQMTCSTFTVAKQVHWSGGIAGGPFVGYSRWWDTTTAWSSLGTFGVAGSPNGYTATPLVMTALTGVITVRRMA